MTVRMNFGLRKHGLVYEVHPDGALTQSSGFHVTQYPQLEIWDDPEDPILHGRKFVRVYVPDLNEEAVHVPFLTNDERAILLARKDGWNRISVCEYTESDACMFKYTR